MKSALVSVALLTVACGSKQTGSQDVGSAGSATTETAQPVTSQPRSESRTVTTPGHASSWFCFTLGRHAADTQCESSETDCKSLLDTVREAAPQAAAKASCAAHSGAVFCFEEADTGGTARLCSDTQKGCDDARKGAAAEEVARPTGSKIGACAETR